MGAKLIRNGHVNVATYRMSFFNIAIEELFDSISETIRYNALSHRASNLEGDEFTKFMRDGDKKRDTTPVEIDHEAQMREASKG